MVWTKSKHDNLKWIPHAERGNLWCDVKLSTICVYISVSLNGKTVFSTLSFITHCIIFNVTKIGEHFLPFDRCKWSELTLFYKLNKLLNLLTGITSWFWISSSRLWIMRLLSRKRPMSCRDYWVSHSLYSDKSFEFQTNCMFDYLVL